MARVAKVDNAFKKRFDRNEKKRTVGTRNKMVYFLIICEGAKTEPNYFSALEKELPRGTIELKIDGTGRNTIGLVKYAIRQRDESIRKYDRVWAVFDKDDFPNKSFNGAIKVASNNNINCAWTNEAFELWFLLHFQYVNTGMNRDDYKAYLEREIINKTGNQSYKYLKNDPKTFSILKIHGNQSQAILWAAQLKLNHTDQRFYKHNPCTLVHELIYELMHPQEVLDKLKKD